MEFSAIVSTFGTLHSKRPSSNTDPIALARKKFTANVQRQIKALKEGVDMDRRGWSCKYPDGTLSLTLRNGNATMKLSGNDTHIVVASTERAIDFYNFALEQCSSGALDEKFMATRRTTNTAQ